MGTLIRKAFEKQLLTSTSYSTPNCLPDSTPFSPSTATTESTVTTLVAPPNSRKQTSSTICYQVKFVIRNFLMMAAFGEAYEIDLFIISLHISVNTDSSCTWLSYAAFHKHTLPMQSCLYVSAYTCSACTECLSFLAHKYFFPYLLPTHNHLKPGLAEVILANFFDPLSQEVRSMMLAPFWVHFESLSFRFGFHCWTLFGAQGSIFVPSCFSLVYMGTLIRKAFAKQLLTSTSNSTPNCLPDATPFSPSTAITESTVTTPVAPPNCRKQTNSTICYQVELFFWWWRHSTKPMKLIYSSP